MNNTNLEVTLESPQFGFTLEGSSGLDAYQLWLREGNTGTIEEFLASLQGKTAYQSAVDGGYTGTEAQFNLDLKEISNKSDITHTHDFIQNAIEDNAKIEASSSGAVITRNVADGSTILTVQGAASSWGRLAEFKSGSVIKAFISGTGAYQTDSGMANYGFGADHAYVKVPSTGTEISRNKADANPALKVNQANASSTGNIATFQFGGADKAWFSANGTLFSQNWQSIYGGSYGNFNLLTNGPTFSRNIGDANPTLKINNASSSSTGNIAEFQFNGTTKLAIDKNGLLPATNVTNTPSGNIVATTVQGAINELDTEKADKLYATNLITNGDFSNGTTGWSATASTNAVSNKVLSNTANGTSQYVRAYTDTAQSVVVGNKIYARFSLKVTNANCTQLLCQVQGTVSGSAQNFFSQLTPTQNQVYTSSSIITMGAGTGMYRLQFWHYYPDAATANGKVMEVQYVSLIDLTAIFGAGKEPSAIQMDNMLSTFTNSWFNGTAELVSIANLAQLKADKTQEAWITPTLINGWQTYSSRTFQYRKRQDGVVEFRGSLNPATKTSETFLTMPAGYRPPAGRDAYFNFGSAGYIVFLNSGGAQNWFASWVSFEGVSYSTI